MQVGESLHGVIHFRTFVLRRYEYSKLSAFIFVRFSLSGIEAHDEHLRYNAILI
jgi:hypothetical protein